MTTRISLLPVLIIALVSLQFVTASDAPPAAPPGPSVPELLLIVKSNANALEKSAAIRKLVGISAEDERGNRVVEALIETVQASHANAMASVGRTAVRALTMLQKTIAPRAKALYLDPFIALLRDSRAPAGVRSEIVQCALETFDRAALSDKEKDAVRLMLEIARNKGEANLGLRGRCIETSATLGGPENMPLLCDLLADPENYIKEAAALGICALLLKDSSAAVKVTPAAVGRLIEMMKDEKLEVEFRVAAIRAIAQLIAANVPATQKGVDDLIRIVNTDVRDPMVHAAIEALSVIGNQRAVDALTVAYHEYFRKENPLDPKDLPVRIAVAKATINILSMQSTKSSPDPETVHKTMMLQVEIIDNEPAPSVKEAAIFAMGNSSLDKFKPEHKDAIAALIRLLEKQPADSPLSLPIADALDNITHVTFGLNVKRWKEWFAKHYPDNPK